VSLSFDQQDLVANGLIEGRLCPLFYVVAPEISGDYYALSTRVAEESGMGVLAVDYRTTASIPISPFPAAIEDVIAAMKWLQDQGASKVTLHGDSSGGSCQPFPFCMHVAIC
jgi:hypothetical protein